MSTVLTHRRHGGGNEYCAKSVKYTPCAKNDQTDEDECDEIAVVSPQHFPRPPSPPRPPSTFPRHNSSACNRSREDLAGSPAARRGSCTAINGPRLPPAAFASPTDRTKLIGERLSNTGRISITAPMYSNKVVEQKSTRSTPRHSIFEAVTQRFGTRKSIVHHQDELGYVNKALVATPKGVRKQRKKEIEEKFGKKSSDKFETSTESSVKDGCRCTFVFDPSGRFAYWWSFVVSLAFLYNFWVLIYRFAFEEINNENKAVWFTLDYIADTIYVLDIAFHFRTGYLEDGVLQTDSIKLRIHYMNSTMFYIDLLCLLPLDFLYLSIGFKSMLRCFRLIKIYRFWAFLDRTERHTIYPNVVRTVTLLHYLFAIYHWNACLICIITKHLNVTLSEDGWGLPEQTDDVMTHYLHALYWSTLTLTTIGDLPRPRSKGEYIFVIVEFVFGLLLFASILGHVANIVTSISFARKDFQSKLDSVKTYMMLRRVPIRLQETVFRWFDYLWLSKKSTDEEKTLGLLPDKLRSEIALHVHLDTLKKVEIFQNTEQGFLCELVLKLRPVLFSPGDYICRKGEVGKEMYIVSRGRLQVVTENGKNILALLRAGSYFGEISILNMGSAGNRRTASVRSVGYSDLFVLSKKDLWEVLKDYPTARVRLEAIALKKLQKYKKAPLETGKEDARQAAGLPRSRSTPGLVESSGRVPLRAMNLDETHSMAGTNSSAGGSSRRERLHSPPAEFGSLPDNLTGGASIVEEERSHSPQIPEDESGLRTAASADITNSMTVSSITSYISESSAQKSPSATEPSSPAPLMPPQISVSSTGGHLNQTIHTSVEIPNTFAYVFPTQAQITSSSVPGLPSSTVPLATQRVPSPNMSSHLLAQQPSPLASSSPVPPYQLSPYLPASPYSGTHLHVADNQMGSSSHGSTSPSLLSPGNVMYSPGVYRGGLSPNHAITNSSASLAPDPAHDLMLQEITRLRERLQTLESENASMNAKLHKQQWDVESRLAEIELHVCGSESMGSGSEDKNCSSNKESMI